MARPKGWRLSAAEIPSPIPRIPRSLVGGLNPLAPFHQDDPSFPPSPPFHPKWKVGYPSCIVSTILRLFQCFSTILNLLALGITHQKGLSYLMFELEDLGLLQQGILPICARKTITMANRKCLEKDSPHCGPVQWNSSIRFVETLCVRRNSSTSFLHY